MTQDEMDRLEKYIDQRFTDTEKIQTANFRAVAQQIEGVKTDAKTRFPTREEFTTIIEGIINDVKKMEISNAKINEKADNSALNALRFVSVSGLIISFVSLAIVVYKTFV